MDTASLDLAALDSPYLRQHDGNWLRGRLERRQLDCELAPGADVRVLIRRGARDEIWCGHVESFNVLDGLKLRVWGSGELLHVPRGNVRGAGVIGVHSYSQLVAVRQRQRAGEPAFVVLPKEPPSPKREPVVELNAASVQIVNDYASAQGLTFDEAASALLKIGWRRLRALAKNNAKQRARQRRARVRGIRVGSEVG